MPDPATQFNRAGISVPAMPGIKTELAPPIQLPSTGELWARVGQTALEAGEQLQKSALNPAVRAQLQESMVRAQHGIQYMNALGPNAYMLGRETPQGYEQISPAEAGAKVFPYFQPKIPTPNAPPAPATPTQAPGTGNQPIIQEKPQEKLPEKQDDDTKPPATISAAPTQPAPGFQGPNQAQTNLAIQQALQRNQFASSGQGVPAGYQPPAAPSGPGAPQGTFLNPATGSYEPVQQGPPAAPSAPPQPAPAQPAQPQAPMTPSPQDVASWRAQNAHPVASAQDALAWAKRYHTGYKDATYLPHGGPNGEPAFNFADKTGANNIVPLSQMVKNGFGPSVAAQSTSSVLSLAEQAQQQGPQGPGLPFGPVSPAQQPGQPSLGQQPAPPQPGAMTPSQFATPAQTTPSPQQIAATQPGQQPPGQGPLLTSTAYPPEPYRQGVAQAVAQPGALAAEAGPQAGTRTDVTAQPLPPQPDKSQRTPITDNDKAVFTPEAIAQAKADAANVTPDPSKANENGDPYIRDLGPYHIYRDDTYGTGELYAARPGISNIYKQQRLWLGSDGWDEYETPNTNMRMNMEAEYAGNKGGVGGAPCKNCKNGVFPSFNAKQIANMPVEDMKGWLNLAGQYHNTNGEPNSPITQRLNLLADASQRVNRMADGMDAADKEKIDPTMYSRAAQYQSHQALKRDEVVPPGGFHQVRDLSTVFPTLAEMPNETWWDYHNAAAQGTRKNHFSNYLEQQSQGLNDDITQLQATGRVPFLAKPQEGTSASVSAPGISASFRQGYDPYHSVPSPHQQVTDMFAGDENPKDSRKSMLALKSGYDKQYIQEYEDAITHNWRPTAQAVARYGALKKGTSIIDDENQFKGPDGITRNPFSTGHESTVVFPSRAAPLAPPRGSPQQIESERQGLRHAVSTEIFPSAGALPSGTGAQPNVANTLADAQRIMASHPSGTHFHWTDKQGNVHEYMVP